MNIDRYRISKSVSSFGMPLDDLVVQLQFLRAADYLVDVAAAKHGVQPSQMKKKAPLISAHVRIAEYYIDQAMAGQSQVAFLPLYYAILNLLKIYVLLTRPVGDLQRNRWHGATYDVYGKNSHSLPTEQITLRSGGAIPLFYEVITGRTIPDKTKVSLRSFCPFILDASAEWNLASGSTSGMGLISFKVEKNQNGLWIPQAKVTDVKGLPITGIVSKIQSLKSFRKKRGEDGIFVGNAVSGPVAFEEVRSQTNPYLLYHQPGMSPMTPLSAQEIRWPEELPIVLLFFYMSSVSRYRPDFLDKLADSKYWPFLATVRTHGLTKFLFLLWSFVHKENFSISPQTSSIF